MPANKKAIFRSLTIELLIDFLAGASSVFAFSPFAQSWIAPLTLSLLFRSWFLLPKHRGVLGFSFGLGLFVVGIHWIYISLHDHGGMPAPLAALALLGFSAFVALIPAAAGLLSKYWIRSPHVYNALIVFPACWTLLEWSRTWFCTGFPWLAFGYSQVPSSPLAGWIPVLGVYGATFMVALLAGSIAWCATQPFHLPRCARAFVMGGIVLLSGSALSWIEWSHETGEPLSEAILQGNIPQDNKFSPEHLDAGLRRYAELANSTQAKLIVTPESAIPLLLQDVPPAYWDGLRNIALRNHGDILVGVFTETKPGEIHNSMISLGESPTQHYQKHHLVPFGEFIPLASVIGPVMDFVLKMPIGNQSGGPLGQGVMKVAGQSIAMDICYEDAFGEEIIAALPEATLLVNVSNDAWFGMDVGPEQHLQMAQARALETARPMIRATNTGVSAVISANGTVLRRAPKGEVALLEGTIQGRSGTTPFVQMGNLGLVFLCLSGLFLVGFIRRK